MINLFSLKEGDLEGDQKISLKLGNYVALLYIQYGGRVKREINPLSYSSFILLPSWQFTN